MNDQEDKVAKLSSQLNEAVELLKMGILNVERNTMSDFFVSDEEYRFKDKARNFIKSLEQA